MAFSRFFFGKTKEEEKTELFTARFSSNILTETSVNIGTEAKHRQRVARDIFGGTHGSLPCFVKAFSSRSYIMEEGCLLEVEIAMKLKEAQHDRIIRFFGLWFDKLTKQYALVMEPYEMTLSEYLNGKMKKKEAALFLMKEKLLILYDVATAMVHLQSVDLGIVHGDLHAENVVLMKEGERLVAKIADFSKAAFERESHGPHGRDEIMPPEVLKKYGEYHPTFAVDIFSFGCLVLHVATCRSPKLYVGNSEIEKRSQYIQGLSGLNHKYLKPLIKQCLNNKPAERGSFESIEGMLIKHLKEMKVDIPVTREIGENKVTSNEESHTPEESSSGNRVLQSPKVGQDSQTGNNVSHPNSQELMSNTEHSSEVANLENATRGPNITQPKVDTTGRDTENHPLQKQEDNFITFTESQVSLSNPQKKEEEGSFGAIYYGTLTKADSTRVSCAVKVFNEGTNPEKEVDIARKLSKTKGHKCVVTFYGTWPSSVSTSSQTMSLVMERCHRSNLYDYLKEKKENNRVAIFSLKEKLTLIHDVARGVKFIHNLGIVHGDLHASNVLLVQKERGFRAKVADFGSSVDISNGTLVKDCGKKEFMPPEVIAQLKNSECQLTCAVDVFSFGCLMIHVATCRFPKPEEGGTSAYSSRIYLIEELKGIQKEALQPIIQQLLSEKPEARGSFHSLLSNHGQLSCLLERYREEKAEALEEKTSECCDLGKQVQEQATEIDKIKAENQQLQQSLVHTKDNIRQLENDKDILDRQVIDSQSEMAAKNKELADKEVELTQEKDKFKILQDQQSQTLQGIARLHRESKEAQTKKEELQGQLNDVNAQLKEAEEQNAKLKEECAKLKKAKTEAEKAKETEETLHSQTRETLSKQEARYDDLLRKFQESQRKKSIAEEGRKKLTAKLVAQQAELNKSIAANNTLSKEIEGKRKDLKQAEQRFSEKEREANTVSLSEKKLLDLKGEHEEEIKRLEEEIENLSGGKKSIWENLTKTKTDKDNLEQSFREQESDLTITKRKSKNLEKEVEHHKKDIKDLQQAHERIRKTENEGLHRKIVELQDRIQQQMASLKESEYKRGQAAAEIQEKETEMGETKEQLAIRGNELTQLKEELRMVNGELSETRDVLRDRNTTLEENHEHLSESEKRIRELEKETKNLQSAVIDLKASVLQRENELAEKENKISKTTAELDTKKADCELAVAEKEALKKAITDVTKQHEEEVAQLNRQLLQAGRRIREYEEKEDDIRSNLEDVKGTKKKLNKETQELDKRRRAFYSEKRRFDAQKESQQVLTVPVADQMDDADKKKTLKLEYHILELRRTQSKQDADYRELEKHHSEAIEELSQARDLTVAMNVRTKEPIHSPTPLSGASSTEAMPNSLAIQSSVGMITSLSSLQPSSTISPSILRCSSEPNEVRPSLDTVPSDEDLQVYVVNKCASQWRTIGTLLGLDYETIDSVRGNASLQSVKDKCFEVLMHWKRTRAAGENTWRALLGALRNEDTCRVVVEELEGALKRENVEY